jgi:hypothetical protein
MKKPGGIIFKWLLAWLGLGLIIAGGIPTTVKASAQPDGEFPIAAETAPLSLGIQQWVQQQKLTGSDGTAENFFGLSAAISGDGNTLLIGASSTNIGTNQGAAYVFTRSGGSWIQQAKLTASDGAAGDRFGCSVALSYDGNTALVGASGSDVNGKIDQGAAYIFTRSGGSWTQQAKRIAADGAEGDSFGVSAALSGDGLTALVGTYGKAAAYVFTRSGGAWTQQAKLNRDPSSDLSSFGYSVALSHDGNTALIGDFTFNANRGEVYVFTRSGISWTKQANLTANDGTYQNDFGDSVALSGDGLTALVGAPLADVGGRSTQGAAYLFTRSGASWTQQAKLIANDGTADDHFGGSAALSQDGNTALIGADNADMGGRSNQGAAYVFTRSGLSWTQQAKLIANDGASGDRFGGDTALSSDGKTALVGAYDADVSGQTDQGAAYVFRQQAGTSSGLYLPLIINTGAPLPAVCTLYVENETGGQMCYEIYGTGLGRKCFSESSYFYGTFPAGTYSYQATTVCGTVDQKLYFPEGVKSHVFSCAGFPGGERQINITTTTAAYLREDYL